MIGRVGLLLVFAAACTSGGQPAPPPPARDAAPPPLVKIDPAVGAGLVANDCLSCHLEDMLDQQRLTAKQWAAVVKKMQGWGAPVEPTEVDPLVAYLAARYAVGAGPWTAPRLSAAAAEAAIAPLPDGPYAHGKPQAGKLLWERDCARCHGPDGRGTAMGTKLIDQPGLYRASEFAHAVRTTRGRMPEFKLSDTEIAALLSWLRSIR